MSTFLSNTESTKSVLNLVKITPITTASSEEQNDGFNTVKYNCVGQIRAEDKKWQVILY